MKRQARRHLQHQLQKKSSQPFFTPGSKQVQRNGEKPFFQKQSGPEETEENVQTMGNAESEEQKDTVQSMGADEEKKDNLPVMRQTGGQEDKDQQTNQPR